MMSRSMISLFAAATIGAGASLLGGCSSAPETTHSGFLSDYSRLTPVDKTRMTFQTGKIRNYKAFIVDPVTFMSTRSKLDPEQRATVAVYFRDTVINTLRSKGYEITDRPSTGTARVRIAVTGVNESTWWMKLHPASNMTGAGRGGAAMEGEVIDSVTGEQLGATVQSGVGSQFTLGNFSTTADIQNVIDEWAKIFSQRLDEIRSEKTAP